MRSIDKIVIHCSATPPSMDIGAVAIDEWHRIENRWSGIGYHKVIRRNGAVEQGRDLERVGAHAKGHNSHSIGICMVGGVNSEGKAENNFTLHQFSALLDELIALTADYPDAVIVGHRDLPGVRKSCPCFDVSAWLAPGWASA